MVALVERRAAGGAREAGHVVDQIPGAHHQFRGRDAGSTAGAPRHREQPVETDRERERAESAVVWFFLWGLWFLWGKVGNG